MSGPDENTRVEARIPLAEERLHLEKRAVVSGRVRVHLRTETRIETVSEVLASETVDITHVPIDRIVETAPDMRTEGDLTIVPVLEEVLVVEKKLLLKEELHIRRRRSQETFEVPQTLRRQVAEVERLPGDNAQEHGRADASEPKDNA